MLYNQVAIGADSFFVHDPEVRGQSRTHDEFATPREINSYGAIYPGYAIDQVRFCTKFSRQKKVLLGQILFLRDVAESMGSEIITFSAHRPRGSTRLLRPTVWNNPVYKAVTNQLYAPNEGGVLAREIEGLADIGSCVLDFDVTHLRAEDRLLRWNLLNALAPLAMASAHRQFGVGKIGRHKCWRYCAEKNRLPLAWRWQPDWSTYEKQVEILTATFAGEEERAVYRDALGSGLFYWAQLLSAGGHKVLRFWALPTMAPLQMIACLSMVDDWLEQAVLAMRGQKPASLAEAVNFLPYYQGSRIPHEPSVRLYLWESQ